MRTRLFTLLAFTFVLLPIGIAFAGPIARQSNSNTATLPVQVSQQIIAQGDHWWMIEGVGSTLNLWKILSTSPTTRTSLLTLSNSTPSAIAKYLVKQGVKS
jgi:hypothetical protein